MSPRPLLVLVLLASVALLSGCATTRKPPPAVTVPAGYERVPGWSERGLASWYGPGYAGKKTASGEIYKPANPTAAHRTLPFGSIVEVHNLQNNRIAYVRIDDRGPFVKDRIIDLSERTAKDLGILGPGTAKVELHLLRKK